MGDNCNQCKQTAPIAKVQTHVEYIRKQVDTIVDSVGEIKKEQNENTTQIALNKQSIKRVRNIGSVITGIVGIIIMLIRFVFPDVK